MTDLEALVVAAYVFADEYPVPARGVKGSKNARSCCGAVVFVDESAESVAALDLSATRWRIGSCRVGRQQCQSAMWAFAVVMGGVGAKHRFEMSAADDQQPVETFGADGADEALGVGVRLRCLDRRVDHLDPFAAQDLVEGGGELAVAVVLQEPHPLEQA